MPPADGGTWAAISLASLGFAGSAGMILSFGACRERQRPEKSPIPDAPGSPVYPFVFNTPAFFLRFACFSLAKPILFNSNGGGGIRWAPFPHFPPGCGTHPHPFFE